MDSVVLAVVSAALFGAMTVALRFALAPGADAAVGTLLTIVPAAVVAFAFAVVDGVRDGAPSLVDTWPFALAGLLGPGASQLLFTVAVRDAGPSRTSVVVGTAPLFSVAIALAVLSEPVKAPLLVGAVSIVAGGVLLVGERVRPHGFKLAGLAFAWASTLAFAARDNLVRWLSLDTDVPPALAAAVTLASGALCVLAYVVATRRPLARDGAHRFAVAGLLFGLSYVALFEAYYRGRVTVVLPLVATESLWGVVLSAVLLRRTELVGRNVLAGAVLVVAGAALIGAFR